jgi:hypothetical protein
MLRLAFSGFALFFVGCAPIARDAACVDADACDQALEQPFGSFAATDPQFGDDLNGDGTAGLAGDTGSCWTNAETAKPCVDECNRFRAEQVAIAQAQNNAVVAEACGGALE